MRKEFSSTKSFMILKKNRNIIEIYNEKNMEKSYHVFCNKFPWS